MSFAPLLPATPGLVVEQVILGEEIITRWLVWQLGPPGVLAVRNPVPVSTIMRVARLWIWKSSGRRVQRSLQVRRFRCGMPTYSRRTFRERFPPLAG